MSENEFEFEVLPLHKPGVAKVKPETIQRAGIFANAFSQLLEKNGNKRKLRVNDSPSLVELKGSYSLRQELRKLGFSTRPGRGDQSNTTIITDKREPELIEE